jgi:acetylornithine/N-succinyldiaminopimelate aminotransferase
VIAGENVVRVFPSLIADKAVLDEGLAIIEKAAVSFEKAGATKAAE